MKSLFGCRIAAPLMVLGLVVVFANSALAASTYYVRKTGNDSNSGTNVLQSFKTVAKAASVAGAGDTVYVGAGIYSESVTVANDGTSIKPIKFIADTIGLFTLDAGEVHIAGSTTSFTVNGKDYIQVTGFIFGGDPVDPGGVDDDDDETVSGSASIRWSYCIGGLLNDCELQSSSDALKVTSAELTVDSCDIHDHSSNGIVSEGTSKLTVTGSTVRKCGRRGIYIRQASTALIEQTTISDNSNHGIRTESNTSTDTLVIRRCQVAGNLDGLHVHGRSQITIENSLFVQNRDDGIQIHSGSSPTTINYCTIAYNNGDGIEKDNGTTNVTNSIVAFNDDDGLDVEGGNFTHTYNLVYGNDDNNYQGTSASTGEVSSDPKFLSGSDFHLQSNSPAIDKGGLILSLDIDLEGRLRPVGLNPDWGAYESSVILNPPETPASIYYVRRGGSDSKNGKTPKNAFRTIGKALTVANRAAVTVYIGSGTYNETVVMDVRGASNGFIKFIGDTSGIQTGDAGSVIVKALTATNCQYVLIDSIQWVNAFGTAAYVDNCQLTFTNCTFSGKAFSVATNKGTPVFDRCTVTGGTTAGLQATMGTVTFNNGTITGARRGANIDQGQFLASASNFQNCTEYGLVVTGSGTIANCKVANNQSGAYLTGNNAGDITITNTLFDGMTNTGLVAIKCAGDIYGTGTSTRLTSGGDYGVYLDQSNLVVKNATIAGPQYGFYSKNSTSELRDSAVSSCTVNGVYAKGGNCTFANCSVKTCNRGVFIDFATAAATGCTIEQCSEWGYYHQGKGTVNGCTVKGNNSGAYLVGETTRGDISITDLVVQGSPVNGVYAVRCSGNLSAGTDKVSTGGTYGVYLDDSALTMTNLQMSGSTYGVQAKGSSLVLQNATITGCTRGADFATTTATVTNSKFQQCTDWGYVHSGKGAVNDCLVDNNKQGANLVGTSVRGDITFNNLKIQNCTDNGLLATRCTGTVIYGTGPLTTGGTYGAYFDNSAVTLSKPQISNTQYGVQSYGSIIDIQTATISGCSTNGVYAQGGETKLSASTLNACNRGVNIENGKGTVTSSTFQNCTEWGYYHTGTGSLQDCVMSANKYGACLVGASVRGDITLTNLKVQNSTDNGLSATRCSGTVLAGTGPITTGGTYSAYFNDSDITLTSPQISKSQYGIQAYGSTVTVTSGSISLCPTNGIFASGGVTTLTSCTVSTCSRGVNIENGNAIVTGGLIEKSTEWGYVHAGTGSIQDTVVDANQYGASLTGATTRGDITITNLKVQNTKSHGIAAVRCTGTLIPGTGPITTGGDYGLYFDDSNMTFAGVSVSNAKNGIQAYGSVVDAQGATITGCTSNGVYASGGETKLTSCNVTGGVRGANIENGKATVTACKFENCSDWGYVHTGTGTVTDSTIKNDRYGLYAIGQTQTGDIKITNTIIDGIREYALYATRCEGDVKGNGGKSTSEGAYGIYATSSNMTLSAFDISGSTYGIYSAYGDMTIQNTKTANHAGAGVYAYDNTRFDMTLSRIESCPGMAFNQFAGNATLTNCVISNNAYGAFYRNGTQTRIYNCTFVNNGTYGLWQYSGEGEIKNTVVAGNDTSGSGLLKSAGNLAHSHNLVYGYGTNFSGITSVKTEVTDNPRFANAVSGDYHLAMGSPAISAGTDLSSVVTVDLDGNQRTTFNAFEMGAYEYLNQAGSVRVLKWTEKK